MFLGDMRTCVEKIQSYTAGMTLVSFSANRLVMDATLRPDGIVRSWERLRPTFLRTSGPSLQTCLGERS